MDGQARPGRHAERQLYAQAGKVQADYLAQWRATNAPHRHRGVRDAFVEFEYGCVSRSWLPHATGRRPADLARHSSRLPRSGSFSTNAMRSAAIWGYLWAKRPATEGGSVRHVHAVSSRAIPSPPSRRQAAPSLTLTTVPSTQKTLLLIGKGS